MNITGGNVGNGFTANLGSEVNITGGNVGIFFDANSGSEVNISGGTVGPIFRADPGSSVNLIGEEFRLNGTAPTDSTITVGIDDVLTGTLTDGSVFIFAGRASDRLDGVTLTSSELPTLDTTPTVINSANIDGPSGLRAGQNLTLEAGGQLRDDFAVVGATLNVNGGQIGSGLEAAGSQININSGTIGSNFNAIFGSQVNVNGGSIGVNFDANAGSEVNINGGDIGGLFEANFGSEVNITGGDFNGLVIADSGSVVNIDGGSVGGNFIAESGSVVNIDGGSIGGNFSVNFDAEVNVSGGNFAGSFFVNPGFIAETTITGGDFDGLFSVGFSSEVNISGGEFSGPFETLAGSTINLFGTEFLLNGEPLEALVVGGPLTIGARDVALSGIFADGSAFDFFLGTDPTASDIFPASATITLNLVTAVPEPNSAAMIAVVSCVFMTRRRDRKKIPTL